MTTIELPEALVKRARIYAIRRGTTLRALVEQGLRHVLARKEDTGMKEDVFTHTPVPSLNVDFALSAARHPFDTLFMLHVYCSFPDV